MQTVKKRIVSLLPSTTEIVAALGCRKHLVGRSHECDVPEPVQALPSCTEPKFDTDGQSYALDQRVKALLQEGLSVYRVDAKKLAELQPDLILTQDHCEVCAMAVDEVKKTVKTYLESEVEIISVSPTTLSGVFDSINQIAAALNKKEAGAALIQSMKTKFDDISRECEAFHSKRLLCIEWLDPLMTAGNWVPELAAIANTVPLAAETGAHSPRIKWNRIGGLDPDVLCIMPCGYSIRQTLNEIRSLTKRPGWKNLQAVEKRQVFIADGHHYFNRPGSRLTDSARILAEIAHPSIYPTLKTKGWVNFDEIEYSVHSYGDSDD